MAKPGKKPTWTTELLQQMAEYRAQGMSRARISRALNIPESTLEYWERQPEFRGIYTKRRLEIASTQIAKVLDGADPTAVGARWWLERQLRDEFAPPKQEVKQEVTGSIDLLLKEIDGKGLPHKTNILSVEYLPDEG